MPKSSGEISEILGNLSDSVGEFDASHIAEIIDFIQSSEDYQNIRSGIGSFINAPHSDRQNLEHINRMKIAFLQRNNKDDAKPDTRISTDNLRYQNLKPQKGLTSKLPPIKEGDKREPSSEGGTYRG